jgi:hypothetical protein
MMAITASSSTNVKPVARVLHDAGGFLEKCDRFMAFENCRFHGNSKT